jgi:hypothetical protein
MLAVFLVLRRRRKSQPEQSFSYRRSGRSGVSGAMPELAATQLSQPANPSAMEFDAKKELVPVTELESAVQYQHQKALELPTATSPVAELATYRQQSPYQEQSPHQQPVYHELPRTTISSSPPSTMVQLPVASPDVAGAVAISQQLPSEQQQSPLPEVYGVPAPLKNPDVPQMNKDRLRAELERVRQQRTRLEQMQALEDRERELERMIGDNHD